MLLLSASSYSSDSDSDSSTNMGYSSSSSTISTSTCSTCARRDLKNEYMDHLEHNGWGRRNSKTYKLKYRYARRFFSDDSLRKVKLQAHEENLREHGKYYGLSEEDISASISYFKKEIQQVDRGITPKCLPR